ncbi:MAG: MotA/TolQ/ExbB proton channel family protein [Deltaproteobacteria bacterium]|nr:MotA/TolQ/ExbB proton channel family protein [Deltaproteobacteria bacterium]
MITKLFLGFTLLGAQWVLWFLILLSIASIALIFERWAFFRGANRILEDKITQALKPLAGAERASRGQHLSDSLVADARLRAESRLSWLATIGSNAPFVGLFGTVLGIIRAFHDLSQQGAQGSTIVSAGISEALVATAVGLFVAIPAVVGYNYFQRRVKDMLLTAEKTKNTILGQG